MRVEPTTCGSPTTARTTARASGSDSERAAQFIEQALPHLDKLYNGARRITPTPFDAEDLVQEAILAAYTGFANFRPGTNMRAWLFRIMYNTWVSQYRARQRRPLEVLCDQFTDQQLAGYQQHTPRGLRPAEIEALELLRDDEIADVMDELPLENRMVVYFADVEGLRYREIATLMNTPVGTVMSRLHRGRHRLRELLADTATKRGLGRRSLPSSVA